MWDERYQQTGYAYGTEPNDFLLESFSKLPTGGKILCLADGEGRNGVFLARQGYQVTSVDQSAVGLSKANQLARSHQVSITTNQADLAHYPLGEMCWDGVVSIFAHLPAPLRVKVHQQVISALKPGGVILLEAYTPEQLHYATGGPKDASMLMSEKLLRSELQGLHIELLQEITREVHEGKHHSGLAAVVQCIARKPG